MVHDTGRSHHPLKPPLWIPGKPPWNPGPPTWFSRGNPGRWLIIGYAHGWRGDVQDIKVITDDPCHLFLRYTDKPLRIHLHERHDRGAVALKTPDYCFVEWTEIEEDDPGDHYHHIFHIPSFGPGVELWYYIRGTIGGVLAESVSCAFQVKFHEESQMITLGIFSEAQTLEGEVKLEAGDRITLTRDDAHNSIIITAEAPSVGFWQYIATARPTAPADTTITFDSISTAYELLRITGFLRKQAGAACVITVRLNNDSGNNYFRQILRAEVAVASAFANQGTYGYGGMVDVVVFSPWEALFQSIGIVAQRGFHCRSGHPNKLYLTTNRWTGTARITRIDVAVPGGNQLDSTSALVLEGATP